jgi:hypothetical protein
MYFPSDPPKREGYIFVDAFAEEKLWSQRVMVSFARKMALLGYPVLRFDVMGHGDSDGEFKNATIPSILSDITQK